MFSESLLVGLFAVVTGVMFLVLLIQSSESDRPLAAYKKAGGERDESPWKRQGKGKGRDRPPAGETKADKGEIAHRCVCEVQRMC